MLIKDHKEDSLEDVTIKNEWGSVHMCLSVYVYSCIYTNIHRVGRH